MPGHAGCPTEPASRCLAAPSPIPPLSGLGDAPGPPATGPTTPRPPRGPAALARGPDALRLDPGSLSITRRPQSLPGDVTGPPTGPARVTAAGAGRIAFAGPHGCTVIGVSVEGSWLAGDGARPLRRTGL
ncbi:hypothetical protein E4N62_09830 [Streptomyces sp. MNU76]|uniref:hypothetical protein n=1 Tax=Streptomyces sp. MNU76 TaxID=2560026 RepID=UPI001E2AD71E|nr:hypothetical protein [Streptomyces sp. MNU76]MCC9705538.1 hypothetical protein [Streptomyces sp. MNU76]